MSKSFLGVLLYLIPIIPFLSRAALVIRHRSSAGMVLSEEEHDRQSHLSYVLVLAGFSFSGVLALVLLGRHGGVQALPVYFLFLSFICFLSSGYLQGHKGTWWEDQLGTAFMDSATLTLILSLVVLFVEGEFPAWMEILLPALALGFWGLDHTHRIHIQWRYRGEHSATYGEGKDEGA